MRSLMLLAAPVALLSVPAAGQTAQPAPATAPVAVTPAPVAVTPAAKPQTVLKTICRRVDDEETTGSRVGPAPKVCKTVEVPVKGGSSSSEKAPASAPERGE